jgi:hypothetical protein
MFVKIDMLPHETTSKRGVAQSRAQQHVFQITQ